MEMLIALIWKLIGLFGGAKAIEKLLEDFLMNQAWMPQGLKKYVVPVGGLITGVILSVTGGMPIWDALQLAIVGAGSVFIIHDHPALTAADTSDWNALPPPPPTADGLPVFAAPDGSLHLKQ